MYSGRSSKSSLGTRLQEYYWIRNMTDPVTYLNHSSLTWLASQSVAPIHSTKLQADPRSSHQFVYVDFLCWVVMNQPLVGLANTLTVLSITTENCTLLLTVLLNCLFILYRGPSDMGSQLPSTPYLV